MTTRQTPDAVREAIIAAIMKADANFGYSYRLTKMDDAGEEHTLFMDGFDPAVFEDREDGYPVIEQRCNEARTDAILAALDSRAGDAGEGQAIADVVAERARQMSVEGWSPEHDDQHTDRSLATAAACYTMFAAATDEARNTTDLPGSLASLGKPIRGWAAFLQIWPWDRRWWKPKSRRADLVRAGALIIAEIERLDRREAARG